MFLRRRLKVKIPRPSEASDFRLTAPSSQLIFPHESNSQGGSLGSGLVRPRSPQLRGDAPLASHGAIDKPPFRWSAYAAVDNKVRGHRTSLRSDGTAELVVWVPSLRDSVPPVLPTPHLRAGLMYAVASRLKSRLSGRLAVQAGVELIY
jgi:hypothetical protein